MGFDEVLRKLKKEYESSILDVDEAGVVERIILDSPSLNYIFGGGYPVGRIIELFGPEAGGKSTLSTIIGGEVQKASVNGRDKVVYVDFERTFEKTYASKLGLDLSKDKFFFVRPESGEEGFTIVEELVRTGEIGLVIWDSVATTPTAASIENEYGKSDYGGTAKLMSLGLCKLNPIISKNKTSLILINQLRANVNGGMYANPDKTTGGRAIPFYASLRFRVSRIDDIKEKDETIGLHVRVANKKNKVGLPNRIAELQLYFDRGLDTDYEYSDFLVKLGIVKKAGGWFSNADWKMKVQGQSKIIDFLKKDPEMFRVVKNTVNEMMLSRNQYDIDNPLKDDVDEEFGKE